MTPEEIKQIVSQYYQNLMTMNLEGWLEILEEDALILDPVGKPPLKLKEDAPKFFDLLSKFYDKFEIVQESIFISENEAAVKWKMKVNAKNKKVAHGEGFSIFEISNQSKIKQMKSFWDEEAMKAQLR